MKTTLTLFQAAEVLVDAPTQRWYGNALRRRAHLESGTMYPILRRMRAEGWIVDDGYERLPGRPPRKCFRVTRKGWQEMAMLVALERRRREEMAAAAS